MEALFSAELDRLNTQLNDQQQRETTAAGDNVIFVCALETSILKSESM